MSTVPCRPEAAICSLACRRYANERDAMRTTWARRALAAGAALALDRALGEPPVPDRLHPVALFGSAMTAVERRVYGDSPGPGAVLAAAGLGLAGAAGAVLGSPTVAAYVSTAG